MDKWYIKIIVEGNEEYAFFEIVKELGTADCFNVEIEDAGGYGDIPDSFLESLRSELYDCVLCVYDVDNKANDDSSPFNRVRSSLLSVLGEESIVDAVSYCTNPNILQMFLLAADTLDNVALTSSSKKTNSQIVHKYWSDIASEKRDDKGRLFKPPYTAASWQVDIMKYSIIRGEYSYENLLANANALPLSYKDSLPGSNILPLLIALKNGDIDYFKRIKSALDDESD